MVAFFLYLLKDGCLVTKYFAEPAYIIPAPSCIHLTIFSKAAAHQVIIGMNAGYLETVGQELHKHIAGYLLLCTGKECFNITHDRIKDLSFMQPVAIELRQLVFPVQL